MDHQGTQANVACQVSRGKTVHTEQLATLVLLEAMVNKVFKVQRGLLELLVLKAHGAR